MTDPGDIAERAGLLPEEQAAGSVDPAAQAAAILEESEARIDNEAVGIRADNVAEGAGIDETDAASRDEAARDA